MTNTPEKSGPANATVGLGEREQYIRSLARLDRYARLLDSQFRIPFTRVKFGLDPLIGLLPGVGDVAGLVMSLYLIGEGLKIGAGGKTIAKMAGNVMLEFVVGLVPVFGDAFDLLWQANNRNVALLRAHVESKLKPPSPRRPWLSYALITLFGLLLLGLVVLIAVSLFSGP
ncbi:DUF4112 domain-containing protein [Marinobacter caseinilyticus]|uniref:DUF4112 domain-containing protein n=1 Tax=Marinobacter caseinilyticus TaxID=2692195 RepID=UPI00140860A7|nr:DUF4112 domain-containing protein [Marinobacter caseinilyticus]